MAIDFEKKYTAEEFFQVIPETVEHYELWDGEIVALAAPNVMHQSIVGNLFFEIKSFINKNKGGCKPFVSPFDVKLDDGVVVQPDVLVICNPNKLDDKRCNGAPDFVVEVVSSDRNSDYSVKLEYYKKYGVREYWIIDPREDRTVVYVFDNGRVTDLNIYTFDQPIPINIFGGALEITINELT